MSPLSPETTPTTTQTLKDSKPSRKKLDEAVDYIAMAVKLMAADNSEEVPESVQHTLRWLKKPITRKRKSSNGEAGVEGSS